MLLWQDGWLHVQLALVATPLCVTRRNGSLGDAAHLRPITSVYAMHARSLVHLAEAGSDPVWLYGLLRLSQSVC